LVSTASRLALSSSAKRSASLTMRSTSSPANVLAPVILMSCFLPVPLSAAHSAAGEQDQHAHFQQAARTQEPRPTIILWEGVDA
jgi:hypothetical protein